MTEENMKKLYEHFVATGQTKRAQEILNIPRYAKFAKSSSEEKEEPKDKSKKER